MGEGLLSGHCKARPAARMRYQADKGTYLVVISALGARMRRGDPQGASQLVGVEVNFVRDWERADSRGQKECGRVCKMSPVMIRLGRCDALSLLEAGFFFIFRNAVFISSHSTQRMFPLYDACPLVLHALRLAPTKPVTALRRAVRLCHSLIR
jgi:hypothetical protein